MKMNFTPGLIYHVYNQGNNRQPIFFHERNYYYFLRKMQVHLLPFADLLCYCLMPNHFHFLLVPKEHPRKNALNHSIGVMLRSYTRGVNIEQGRTGSLFRQHTKAKNGIIENTLPIPTDKKANFRMEAGNAYAFQCFLYIHLNPVKAGLARAPEEWPFSSAQGYRNYRHYSVCNRKLAQYLLDLNNDI